jgi:hypothetical protein
LRVIDYQYLRPDDEREFTSEPHMIDSVRTALGRPSATPMPAL